MSEHRERSKKPPRKYNILLVPEGNTGTSYSFRVSQSGVILSVIASVVLIVVVIVLVLVFTPIGKVISIPNPHLEEQYISELLEVQDRLNRVTKDVIFMREYNMQMRRALGEEDTATELQETASLQTRDVRRQGISPGRSPSFDDDLDFDELAMDYGIMGLTSGPVRISPAAGSTFRPTLPITLPADGYVTRRFDASGGHIGIDIAGKVNTPIAAAAEGTVIFSGWTYQDGNMLIISHGGGFFSVYKHNQANIVRQGAVVRRGETIALLGNTGKQSYGPHLHFELWKDGAPIDPAYYLFDIKDSL